MNCPQCRKKLSYEPMLSITSPIPEKKRLVYACGSCDTLLVFMEFITSLKKRGVVVMKNSTLKKAGYTGVTNSAYSVQAGTF